jgi:IS5 family transposase
LQWQWVLPQHRLNSYGSRNDAIDHSRRFTVGQPLAMRLRRETVEHPFGAMKARMGATHFLTKTLAKVTAEMALSVLAYNLTRVMNIVGTKSLMATIVA